VLGVDSSRFIGWLEAAGFRLWQMLPIGPVGDSISPYQASSAFAGNPRLIDPEDLRTSGWLTAAQPLRSNTWSDREQLLHAAWLGFCESGSHEERLELKRYWQSQRSWLLPFALFRVARRRFGNGGWWTWPDGVRRRQPGAIASLLGEASADVQEVAFEQWVFDRQWQVLRSRARDAGIELIGDLPIYVDLDSADVWWHRQLFRVDEVGCPAAVAGVPPDYFSADGQMWGNPLYDWEAMQADDFRWWVDRVRTQLRRFDYLRIDHFRGLQAFWEIPVGASSGREGCWRLAPGAELLAALGAACGGQPFLAEDLGTITEDVQSLRRQFGLPGTLVAQFAFDGAADNPYLPANQVEGAVIYSGTHDNDTVLGWYQSLDAATRQRVHRVLACRPDDVPGALLRSVWQSPAEIAIFPLQDLIGLGSESRMNTPASASGNWLWRLRWEQMPAGLAAGCRQHAIEAARYPLPVSRAYSAS
jgi:4-alpha-glucanotransferase